MKTLEQYKKGRRKDVNSTRTISVPPDIADFFDWLVEKNINRSEIITDLITQDSIYKTFLTAKREKKDDEGK